MKATCADAILRQTKTMKLFKPEYYDDNRLYLSEDDTFEDYIEIENLPIKKKKIRKKINRKQ